ncbi:hypothetical protein GGS26DRAFT_589975 [Hypomontagnella submonticulosa]|nr:hypothetical protein GGS26DRAFT_589975 [Hypomontagnella submonticulosa]
MKFATVAALLPLALAANIEMRQASGLKFLISDFSAACTPESTTCVYDLTIRTNDNPDFSVGCEVSGTSDNGDLPAVSKTKCGTYSVSVAKSGNDGLILSVTLDMKRLTGTYTIPSSDLSTKTSGDKKVQSYTGKLAFNIDIQNASSTSAPASSTTTSTSTTSASSTSSSASSTTASEPSTTDTTTSSSASPSPTNGATRESGFGGALFAAGLAALII